MARNSRNTIILAKIETTPGIDAVPTGAANALLVSDPTFDFSYNNVDRNLVKGFMGADAQLVGTRFVDIGFSIEIAGSGTAGTAPAWGPLLKACALAEVVTAGSRVEYAPVSTGLQTLTIYYHKDGVLHKALGCMGNVQLSMGEGERPLFKLTYKGVDGGIVATANPTATLTNWKPPQVIQNASTPGIKLGATYSAGALTGGTVYNSRGLNLDIGNDVKAIAMLGMQSVDITNRNMSGSMQLQLAAADEVSLMTDINSNTLTGLSFEHGTTAGSKILIHSPSVQRINPKTQDYEGRIHIAMDLRLLPVSGNDEIRIVCL